MRGRHLKVPAGAALRPTQDAVREALFSMLMLEVPQSNFLDLFAGTGSVGIEAWSRGAATVTWVESDRRTTRTLRENVDTLCGPGDHRVVTDDVFRWLERGDRGPSWDLVFADPPYGDATTDDGIEQLLVLLAASGRMAAGGIFVAEQRTGRPMPQAPGWNRIKDRRYGQTRLVMFSPLSFNT